MGDKVTVRRREGEDRFTFSFHLHIPDLKIDKQFNLNREVKEETTAFIDRLGSNITKANKKKKNFVDDGEEERRLKPQFLVKDLVVQADAYKTVGDFLFLNSVSLVVDSRHLRLSVNPPMVTELKVSEVMMTGCLVYPHKLELEFAEEELTEVEWFASQRVEERQASANKKAKVESEDALVWRRVGKGRLYTPSLQDVQCRLKCSVTPHRTGVAGDCRSFSPATPVTLGPGECPFQARAAWTASPLCGPGQLRVVTYNILADLYADSEYSRTVLFAQCPPYALAIDYRVKLVLQELMGYQADLLCLQEVDQKVFDLHLSPLLATVGLEGCFVKKGRQVSEGLAIFWRTCRLSLLEQSSVFLPEVVQGGTYGYLWDRVKDNPALVETLTQRTTTLAVAVLRVADSRDILVVGDTHLYFKPDVDHIRLLQAELCREELERVRRRLEEEQPDCRVSILLCGDFNSTPQYSGHMGGVLQYLTEGSIPSSHPDWSSRPGEEVEHLSLTSPTVFTSAAGTPAFTNYTREFKDCLDYIFIEQGRLEVVQVVPFPTVEELSLHEAIPSIVFPSDHVAVVVDLQLTGH